MAENILNHQLGLPDMDKEDDYIEPFETNEDDFEDEEVSPEKPFDPNKITLLIKQPTIDNLMKRIMANPAEIDLKTKFQRKPGLWKDEQKSRLIESLLLRIPLPAFYFDGTDDDNWLVVDGLQRLKTFKEFMGEKSLRLKALEYLDYNGYNYDDLPRNMQRRIEETQIIAYVIQPGTPEDVKYNIFKRINTGGLPLSPQEIRHALNQGIPAEYLKELAELSEFTRVIGDIQKERMEDREIVLRFLAFYLNGYESYKPDMDTFLNKAIKSLNDISEVKRDEYRERFRIAMERAWQLFGNKAFRKISQVANGKIRRNPLNKALFDVWSVALAGLDLKEYERLARGKKILMEEFMILLKNDSQFERSITSGTGGVFEVNTRFRRIKELIEKVLKND
jgi:hypothetical protein